MQSKTLLSFSHHIFSLNLILYQAAGCLGICSYTLDFPSELKHGQYNSLYYYHPSIPAKLQQKSQMKSKFMSFGNSTAWSFCWKEDQFKHGQH